MTKLSEENLTKIGRIELVINRNLFLICTIITIIVMAMAAIEFLSRGSFFPSRIGFFYIGVLFIYTAHKEMLRWLEEKGVERQGEIFLYSCYSDSNRLNRNVLCIDKKINYFAQYSNEQM